MLKQDGVAPQGRIEEAQVKDALKGGEQEGDGYDGSTQNHDQARCVMRPDKQRKAKPSHAGSTHGVDSDDEVEAGKNGREAIDEDTDDRRGDRGIRIDAAERSVEGPAGIQAPGAEGVQHEGAADNIEIPAQEIDFREGQVLCSDHDGNQEIPENSGDRRDEEEENHGHAVHGEELVVGFRTDQHAAGGQEMNADHGGEDAANEEENRDGGEVEQGDALVVGGEQPRTDAGSVSGIQIMRIRQFRFWQWRCGAHDLSFLRGRGGFRYRGHSGALGGNGLRLQRFYVSG